MVQWERNIKPLAMYQKIMRAEAERADPEKRYREPLGMLSETLKFAQSVGLDRFLHGAGYNTQRESLTAFMFALGIRKLIGQECYIRQPKNDPPDFYLLYPANDSKDGVPFLEGKVEVVTVPQIADAQEDPAAWAVECLKRSKLDNHYQPGSNTVLVIFINAQHAVAIKAAIEGLYNEPEKLFSKFSEVYVCHLITGLFFYHFARIGGGPGRDVDVKEELVKRYQNPLLEKYGVIVEDDE
jgi:hypothetical protein